MTGSCQKGELVGSAGNDDSEAAKHGGRENPLTLTAQWGSE